MPYRVSERFESYRRLQAENSKRDADLLNVIQSFGIIGSVFHLLKDIPEQGEDLLTVLIDDQFVVSFEVPRGASPPPTEEISVVPIAQYRSELGQGRNRIRLDKTITDTRTILAKSSGR